MKIIGVIPARYQSTRMPGKPIMDILGKPMIWWVYQQAKKSKLIDEIMVATDDERIKEVCVNNNINCILTSKEHDTPTSRLYEVSTTVEGDLFLLIMGDEPLVDERCFELIVPQCYDDMDEQYVAVLTNTIDNPAEVIDFSNQKVVTNRNNEIMFISRSPIPYPKGILDITYQKVTGVQIFSKQALEFYNKTEKSTVEKAEENDLMRFIENDIKVNAILSPYKTISVDTPKDLAEVIRIKESGVSNFVD